MIREARDADAAGLIALLGAVLPEFPRSVFVLDEMPELTAIATWARAHDGAFWVAEREGAIVGCIGCAPHGAGLELKKLYVAKVERRNGLGAKLLALVEAEAARRNAAFLELWSDDRFHDAHRFYARHGFVDTRETRPLWDASFTVEKHFWKTLRR